MSLGFLSLSIFRKVVNNSFTTPVSLVSTPQGMRSNFLTGKFADAALWQQFLSRLFAHLSLNIFNKGRGRLICKQYVMCSILTEVLKELWIFVLYKPMYLAYEYVVGLRVTVVCISSMGLRATKLSASTEV